VKEATLARAKNVARAEARRRARAALRSREEIDELDEEAAEDAAIAAAADVPEPRKPIFQAPRFREDLRLLPSIFRARRALWIPPILLIAGFVLTLLWAGLPASILPIVDLYLQFFFVMPPLFTFFLAGFLAPRASYLIGFLVAMFAAVLWAILIIGFGIAYQLGVGAVLVPEVERGLLTVDYFIIGAVYGTIAAAFAAWYRDFLRNMRERGDQRRQEREIEARAKRRQERQEARRGTR
jgi:hypothetical protein